MIKPWNFSDIAFCWLRVSTSDSTSPLVRSHLHSISLFHRCLWLALWLGIGLLTPKAADAPAMPMPIDEPETGMARWLDKPVLASRVLDNMENPANWSHYGFGEMNFTQERAQDGLQAIRLTSPTKADKPGATTGRPFGEAGLRRNFDNEDWREFNRLSFFVYPTVPGFKVISLLVKLHNDGETKVPDAYGREGLNYFLVKSGEWNHVVWEIPHLARDKVTGVSLIYRLQGNEPEATNRVCFDFDHLELQRVKPDHYEGWAVAPDKIAYSHTGYTLGGVKTALVNGLAATQFEIIRPDNGQVVLSKAIRPISSRLGSFQLLDFSEIREPGQYVIHVGDQLTPPFQISDQVWRGTIWKTINFFYCERCGIEVPGIHGVCHRDWEAVHGDRKIIINGGWHDAGDLSQGSVNTAEAVYAMFSLADQFRMNAQLQRKEAKPAPSPKTKEIKPSTPSEDVLIAQRLIEEAKWGLAWLLKTRFGDGYRVTWATMDFWTDGVPGTVDDVRGDTRNSPFENFLATSAEARAARVLRDMDPGLAEKALQAAKEDWRFALDKAATPNLEVASAGVLASMELYKATGQTNYAGKAIELADIILKCQQRDIPDWRIPLTGFFYTTPRYDRILHYTHRGHEQAPIVALTELCAAFPRHQAWMQWYSAVLLHSEYLNTMAKFTGPYGMLPNGVYNQNDSSEKWFQEQVTKGVQLSSQFFLRLFPVWTSFRGNHGTVLSQTKALAAAAHLRHNLELANICQLQLEWVVGRNPFAQSTMYGEGHNYAPQYTAMSGDMVGSLPVGIQTRANEDQPYWPAANCYNYKEVWVHPSSRWLWLMQDLNGPAQVSGQVQLKETKAIEFIEALTGKTTVVKPESKTGKFQAQLAEGEYLVRQGDKQQSLTVLPGQASSLDLRQGLQFELSQDTKPDGTVTIQLKATGTGMHYFALRTHNLALESPVQQLATMTPNKPQILRWITKVTSPKQHWVALVIPDDELERRQEIFGALPR